MGLCVCVSKNQKNQRGTKKKSVEHGDLKIKINSGFQNSGPELTTERILCSD